MEAYEYDTLKKNVNKLMYTPSFATDECEKSNLGSESNETRAEKKYPAQEMQDVFRSCKNVNQRKKNHNCGVIVSKISIMPLQSRENRSKTF